MLEDAGRTALELKDEAALSRILSHCGPQSRGLSDRIMQMRQQVVESGKKK